MPHALSGDLEIFFDTFGQPDDPPVILIMGLGAQMIVWDEELCHGLVDRGFFVIRYDNRDVGLSSRVESDIDEGVQIAAGLAGQPVEAPYFLSDMAADAMAVLDHLGIERAHVVGASMGGMIAQTVAIDHPHRVQTLTSIMSNTGSDDAGQPDPAALTALMAVMVDPPTDREGAVQAAVETNKIIDPVYFDEDRTRDMAARTYDRADDTEGFMRHLLAIRASGSRDEALRRLDVPTLVIHGTEDPLVTPSGGERTAECIAGAELMMIEGMGHGSPPELWPRYYEALVALAARST
jgi:pimeloyl-ACP methyl ester carboxylesterase